MHEEGRRPNLFIIGAMKSGTTSLHHYLSSHPEIFMCEPKEPGFFVPELSFYPRDEAWYRSLFAEAGEARYVGESSTHYTKLPVYTGVVERIAAYSPEARFIYIMRDPVERAISQYWDHVRLFGLQKPLLQALREDPEFRAFSNYPTQLEPYFEQFGRDRVLCLTFEELVANPSRTASNVFGWLDLPMEATIPELRKQNARPDEVARMRGRGLLGRLAHSAMWERVAPAVPGALKRLGHRLAFETIVPAEVSTQEAAEFLRPEMVDVVDRLSHLLGREFPEWTTTRAASSEFSAEKDRRQGSSTDRSARVAPT